MKIIILATITFFLSSFCYSQAEFKFPAPPDNKYLLDSTILKQISSEIMLNTNEDQKNLNKTEIKEKAFVINVLRIPEIDTLHNVINISVDTSTAYVWVLDELFKIKFPDKKVLKIKDEKEKKYISLVKPFILVAEYAYFIPGLYSDDYLYNSLYYSFSDYLTYIKIKDQHKYKDIIDDKELIIDSKNRLFDSINSFFEYHFLSIENYVNIYKKHLTWQKNRTEKIKQFIRPNDNDTIKVRIRGGI